MSEMDAELHEVLETLATVAAVHDHPELADDARAARRRLADPRFRVVVMGEYKGGKSSLVNAVLDARVTAVDDDVATSTRVEVGFADPAGARLWRRDPESGEEIVEAVPLDRVASAAVRDDVDVLRIGLPHPLLRNGLVLVDTPGVGGIGSAAAVVTASSLRTAHAALFVTDASQELTRPELAALADAVDRCGNVALVVTKTDLYPAWRDIVAADREHLATRGLKVPILTVSTVLRRRALADQDREVNAESGYPELVRLLRDELATDGHRLVRRGCHRSVHRIARVLAMPLRHEHDRLEGASDAEIDAALTDARRRGTEFTERAKKWQQIMSDGLTDLIAEADADLRGRLRAIVRDAESLLDDNDPDAVWDEFEPDLYRRTAEALDANLTLLRDGGETLAATISDHLDDESAELGLLGSASAGDELADTEIERSDGTQRSSGERAQQAFKAGYGGAMPIMMVGGMALGVLGLGTLVMPLAGAAGLLAGRKALKDDRDKQLQQRRQQAKAAVKRYIDDTTFRAANERKQAQRDLQRSLRDHFTARVRELARVHDREIEALKSAAASDQEERRARAGEVRAELDRLRAVVRRADTALAADDTSPHEPASHSEPASDREPASRPGARSPEAAHG